MRWNKNNNNLNREKNNKYGTVGKRHNDHQQYCWQISDAPISTVRIRAPHQYGIKWRNIVTF